MRGRIGISRARFDFSRFGRGEGMRSFLFFIELKWILRLVRLFGNYGHFV